MIAEPEVEFLDKKTNKQRPLVIKHQNINDNSQLLSKSLTNS